MSEQRVSAWSLRERLLDAQDCFQPGSCDRWIDHVDALNTVIDMLDAEYVVSEAMIDAMIRAADEFWKAHEGECAVSVFRARLRFELSAALAVLKQECEAKR